MSIHCRSTTVAGSGDAEVRQISLVFVKEAVGISRATLLGKSQHT